MQRRNSHNSTSSSAGGLGARARRWVAGLFNTADSSVAVVPSGAMEEPVVSDITFGRQGGEEDEAKGALKPK